MVAFSPNPVRSLSGQFSIRRDRNGLRPVYNLGNELGDCPFRCAFCSVGQSNRVTTDQNIAEFDRQHQEALTALDGPYHPLIYNQGNVTNPPEFSRATLWHILEVFAEDPRVEFVSLNSRACHATPSFFEFIHDLDLPFPVHFIFGVESTSDRLFEIFGKDTAGEFPKFIERIRPFNQPEIRNQPERGYAFGLDLNLVFLPEMYLEPPQERSGNEELIEQGMIDDLIRMLEQLDPSVPVEINLHPYHRVETLDYEDLDLGFFMGLLPRFEATIDHFNAHFGGRPIHLFVGVEGSGFDSAFQRDRVAEWKAAIGRFNIGS